MHSRQAVIRIGETEDRDLRGGVGPWGGGTAPVHQLGVLRDRCKLPRCVVRLGVSTGG